GRGGGHRPSVATVRDGADPAATAPLRAAPLRGADAPRTRPTGRLARVADGEHHRVPVRGCARAPDPGCGDRAGSHRRACRQGAVPPGDGLVPGPDLRLPGRGADRAVARTPAD